MVLSRQPQRDYGGLSNGQFVGVVATLEAAAVYDPVVLRMSVQALEPLEITLLDAFRK